MAVDNNLGNLNATVSFTPETEEFERKTAEMAAKIKRQFDELGGKTISQLAQDFNGLTNTVTSGIDAINAGIAKVKNVAELGFLGVGLGNFVHQVFQTRSYFQDAASSMKTFLGDAEKGAKFTKELQDYAFYNMYEFSDLIGVSKQLIAYGTTDTKEIITVVDQLSNIATGTGADINSMIDIYNKVKASGTANGIVLDQLASRGLLVKQTLQEMGETVNGNKVTFEQFQKVLKHVTDEGGMFHDLMKDQLNNLSASSAQLSDNLTAMYNEIGEKAEPYMKEAIDLAGLIVENYQEVAAVLFDIAKAYGIYKVAASVIEWNKNSQEEEHIKRLAEEKVALEEAAEATKAFKNEDLQAEVAKNKLTQAEADQIAKLREQVQEENKLRISKGDLTQEQAKELAIIKEGLLRREQELKKIKDQADEEVKAKEKEIAAIEQKIAAQKEEVKTANSFGNEGKFIAEAEAKKLNNLESQKQQLETAKVAAAKRAEAAAVQKNEIATARETAEKAKNAKTSNIWQRGMTAAGSALKGIGSNIAALFNPTTLAITAVGFLAEKIIEVATAETALEKEQKKSMQIREEYISNVGKEQAELDNLYGKLATLQKGTDAYNETKNTIISKYGEYLKYLGKEKEALEDIEGVYKDIKSAIEEKYKAEALAKTENQRIESEMEAYKKLQMAAEKYTDKFSEKTSAPSWYKSMYRNNISKFISDIREQASMIDFTADDAQKRFFDAVAEASKENNEILNSIYNAKDKDWGATFQELGAKAAAGAVNGVTFGLTGLFDIDDKIEAALNPDEFLSLFEELKAAQSEYFDNTRYYSTFWNSKKNGNDNKENKLTPQAQIQKAKEDAKKYIEEYAKIVADIRKEKRKINTDINLEEDERVYKLNKVDTDKGDEIKALDARTIISEKRKEALKEEYKKAANTELEIAKTEYLKITQDIAKYQKQASEINLTEKKDQKTGKDLTSEQIQERTVTYNGLIAKIGELTAKQLGYQEVIKANAEWEKNYQRIIKITNEQKDKFISDEVKKQNDITDSYRKLRKELSIMFEDDQLSDEQYRNLSFQLDINEERERQQEYINVYGGYYVKREQLVREWEQKLANVPPEYFNVAKQKMVEELSKMDFSQFKENLNWDAIFGDLSKQTAKTLSKNLKDLQTAFNAQKGNMGIEEIKTVQEAIGKLNDELAKRNPWKAMFQAAKDLRAAHEKIPELEEKQAQAREELTQAQEAYNEALAERQAVEDQITNGFLDGLEATEQLEKANENLSDATKDLNDKEQQLKNTNAELVETTQKAADAQGKLGEGWKSVGNYISQAGSALSKIGGELGEDGEKLKDIGDQFSNIGSVLTDTVNSFGNKGAAIQQAINATVQMVTNVIASRKKAKKEQEDWAKSQRAFITNMNLAEIENERLRTKDSGNWARDYLSEAKDAAEAYTKAQSKLYDKMLEISEKGKAKLGMREKLDWGTVGKNTALGAGAGAAIGSIIPGIGTAIGAAVGTVVGAVGGFISGLFAKKNKKVWGDLMTQFPELIEKAENGEERINVELADQLIAQGMINDETKELIEEAKKYQEEMDAARKQIEEIADSLMGSLGNNLRSALVDAFTEGTDAAEALHKTVNSTLEDMVSQLLYGARLAPIFEKIKKAMADSLQSGGGALEMIDIISQHYGELETASNRYTNDLQTVKEYAEGKGWDLFTGAQQERNAVSGGIANVTQDTAEEMNGRLTQIQSHTFAINENMKLMVNMQTTQLTILQGIHTDTGQLHAIRADISAVKATLSDIQVRGLKLKE